MSSKGGFTVCRELHRFVSCHQVSHYTSLSEKLWMTGLEVTGRGEDAIDC